MEHEHESTPRPRSPLVAALMAVAPTVIYEIISDAQHWIRGQPMLGTQYQGNVGINNTTANLLSTGVGTYLTTTGLGMAAPVVSYFVREWVLTIDKVPIGSSVNPTEQLEKELKRLGSELTQKMGQICWELEPMKETLEEIRKAVTEPAKQGSEEKRLDADNLYRRGLVTEAITALQEAISPRLNPTNYGAHRLLGYILLHEFKDYSAALQHFQAAAEYAEKVHDRTFVAAECHVYAAVSAYLGNQLEIALSECEAALQLDSGLAEALYIRAKTLARRGKGSMAATVLKQAIAAARSLTLGQPNLVGDTTYQFFALKDADLSNIPQVQLLLERLQSPNVNLESKDEQGKTLYDTLG